MAQTDVGRLHVSTIWLGLNHAYGFDAEPEIFETPIFENSDGAERDWSEKWCYRYPTESAAKIMHDDVVAKFGSMNLDFTTDGYRRRIG